MLKKIEDWNYYELLSVERTASQDEIWAAYQAALATYRDGSPALYGLVGEAERNLIHDRIQEAVQTLRDPEKRREYDLALLRHAPYFPPKAAFRKSIGKLEIEEAPPKKGFGAWLKRLFANLTHS
jgi:DnaJ-class molecular chaperone